MCGHDFWKRVDDLRDSKFGISVKALSDGTGLKYQRLKEQRSNETIPKAEDLVLIADFLGVSVDFLLKGESVGPHLPSRLQAVVDLLSRDEDKLAAVETLLGLNGRVGNYGVEAG